MAILHDHDHWADFPGGDEIVENPVRLTVGDPCLMTDRDRPPAETGEATADPAAEGSAATDVVVEINERDRVAVPRGRDRRRHAARRATIDDLAPRRRVRRRSLRRTDEWKREPEQSNGGWEQ